MRTSPEQGKEKLVYLFIVASYSKVTIIILPTYARLRRVEKKKNLNLPIIMYLNNWGLEPTHFLCFVCLAFLIIIKEEAGILNWEKPIKIDW